jgi:hypothetical protein
MCPAFGTLIDSIISNINENPGSECTRMKTVLGRLRMSSRIRTFAASKLWIPQRAESTIVFAYMNRKDSGHVEFDADGLAGGRIEYIYVNTDSARLASFESTGASGSLAETVRFLLQHEYGHGHANLDDSPANIGAVNAYGDYCISSGSSAPPAPAPPIPGEEECYLGPAYRLRAGLQDRVSADYSTCENSEAPTPPTGGNYRGEDGFQVCYEHFQVIVTLENIGGLWVVKSIDEYYLGYSCWQNGNMT